MPSIPSRALARPSRALFTWPGPRKQVLEGQNPHKSVMKQQANGTGASRDPDHRASPQSGPEASQMGSRPEKINGSRLHGTGSQTAAKYKSAGAGVRRPPGPRFAVEGGFARSQNYSPDHVGGHGPKATPDVPRSLPPTAGQPRMHPGLMVIHNHDNKVDRKQ